MLSNFTCLKDFVQPVPICQSEADIGSVLCIFQHLKCKLLAIPQGESSWGVVYPQDVLGIIAQAWWGTKTPTVSQTKNTAAHQEMTGMTAFDLQSIIKPVMVYQGSMKLNEFLSQIQDNPRLDNQDEYLIIDGSELKGKLDQAKIIQYLSQKSPEFSQNTSQVSTPLSSLLCDLINLIPLPMKLETGAGIELSCNKCWQQLVNQNNLNTSSVCQITSHRGSYVGLRNNLASSSAHRLSEQPINSCFDICSPTPYLREVTKSLLLDSPDSEQNHSFATSSNLMEDNASSWSYLKIPLADQLPFLGTEEQDAYCLVIATRGTSNKPVHEVEPNPTKKTSNTVTNNLLTSIGHELKSPLTGIVGLSSLLNEQKLGQLNQRQTRYVELIHRSGQKMMEIIDDLLQLTRLAVEHQEPEIINLEFLCRQLYRETVTKVNKSNVENSEGVHTASSLKLDIELGSEIAIANDMLLSCVLSHLILETIRIDKSSNKLDIKISNLSGSTAIVIGNNLSDYDLGLSSPENHSSSTPDLGLDLVIAEYLAEVLNGSVTRICSTDRCQFTLLLPKNQNHTLAQAKDSNLSNKPSATPKQADNSDSNLTILCLYPEPEAIDLQVGNSNNPNFNLKSWTENSEQHSNYQHRIIEADSLEQAHTLARIWQLDVIILDSYQLLHPDSYLRSLLESEYLAALPLITLDTRTTEVANKISGLNVYPCLLPAQQCSVQDLMQVIQIATGS